MKFLCVTFLVFCLLGLCFGQRKKSANPQPKKTSVSNNKPEPSLPEYLAYYPFYSKPFDGINWEKVPTSFRGHSMKQIYKAVEDKFYKSKDEFETTENYLSRLDNTQKQPLFGQTLLNSTLSMVGQPDRVQYDADTQKLSISLSMNQVFVDFGNYAASKSINSKVDYQPKQCGYSGLEQELESASTYVGQNAYGAKTIVENLKYNFYGLAFSNYEKFLNSHTGSKYEKFFKSSYTGDFAFKIKIDAEKAREAKNTLHILYLFHLAPPYKGWSNKMKSPTLQNPKDEVRYSLCNFGEVSEIWFYNRETGYIYHKEKIN